MKACQLTRTKIPPPPKKINLLCFTDQILQQTLLHHLQEGSQEEALVPLGILSWDAGRSQGFSNITI